MNKLLLLSLFCIVCALPVGAHAVNPSAEYPAAGENGHPLPRRQADAALRAAVRQYLSEVEKAGIEQHSLMILHHGDVVAERWMHEGAPGKPQYVYSVSKTVNSLAVAIAIGEGRLSLDDKVISFFPDKLPDSVSGNLKNMEVRHLLSMSCGHDRDRLDLVRSSDEDWVGQFLSYPVVHAPGKVFVYNDLASYMLSAIVQRVSGQKVCDYLTPRLFRPLGIGGIKWQESPQGINCGGWGLFLKTEDMAKIGQLLLQNGMWEGKRILPAWWVGEATREQVSNISPGTPADQVATLRATSQWAQGYGYQLWRSLDGCYRADGAYGQYIVVAPRQDAVVVVTEYTDRGGTQLDLIWKYLLPALD